MFIIPILKHQFLRSAVAVAFPSSAVQRRLSVKKLHRIQFQFALYQCN